MYQSTARPLGVLPTVALSPEHLEMLHALEAYDLWFVAERLEKKGLVPSPEIGPAIREFKRYMALIGLGYRGIGMASAWVDEVWHAFLLFTHEYDAFCRSILGEFIHHVPRTSRTPVSRHTIGPFAEAYARLFGEPRGLWSQAVGRRSLADCGDAECSDEAPLAMTALAAVADCGEGECTSD
jgi:hypothetical protein